eukprot:TRINITY_DN3269_c0_g1_i6.p1 TRINITY_DN3269_c0_g1~~TRINITY_DN3269_c0_g1_i6.p1  ORF type:complete len:186 (-),score=33.92 TRINITY_DN3269_c0_g1_i6:210-767(-)
MIRRPPRSTQSRSSAASDVYKSQVLRLWLWLTGGWCSGCVPGLLLLLARCRLASSTGSCCVGVRIIGTLHVIFLLLLVTLVGLAPPLALCVAGFEKLLHNTIGVHVLVHQHGHQFFVAGPFLRDHRANLRQQLALISGKLGGFGPTLGMVGMLPFWTVRTFWCGVAVPPQGLSCHAVPCDPRTLR